MRRISGVAKENRHWEILSLDMRGVEVARRSETAGFDWVFVDIERRVPSTETGFQSFDPALKREYQ